MPIVLITVLASWTVIGWFVALIWSVASFRREVSAPEKGVHQPQLCDPLSHSTAPAGRNSTCLPELLSEIVTERRSTGIPSPLMPTSATLRRRLLG